MSYILRAVAWGVCVLALSASAFAQEAATYGGRFVFDATSLTLRSGTGAPDAGLGSISDVYFRLDSPVVYLKTASGWVVWSPTTGPGAAGTFLRSTGSAWAASTLVLPNAATQYRIPYATATNTIGESANLTFTGSELSLTGTATVYGAMTQSLTSGTTRFTRNTNDGSAAVDTLLSRSGTTKWIYGMGAWSGDEFDFQDGSALVARFYRTTGEAFFKGNVGIGDSPTSLGTNIRTLHVADAANGAGVFFGGNRYFYSDTTNLTIYGGAQLRLRHNTSGTGGVVISLGTSYPLYSYADSGGVGWTNANPYTGGAMHYMASGTHYLYSGNTVGFVSTATGVTANGPMASNNAGIGLSAGIYDGLYTRGWAAIGDDNSYLIFGGYRSSQWGGVKLYASGGEVTRIVASGVNPSTGYTKDLGTLASKWRAVHGAELWIETLVAQDVMATIGGRINVAPTTMLTADLSSGGTTITVKHNALENGDSVRMESDGKVEFLTITSSAGGSSGAYTYSVTRNVDGSGANEWFAGDAMVKYGTTGDGFIDIYSTTGVFSGSGPAIVGHVKTGTAYNAVSPRWAIGNLNGVGYGSYATDVYGAAFGDPSGAHVIVDATNGVRLRHGTTNKITLSPSGDATFAGSVTSESGNIAGWTLTAYYFYNGSGSSQVGLATGTDCGVPYLRMWAGSASGCSAPFRLHADGSLYASSATITGTVTSANLTATGGSIGACTLSATNMVCTDEGIVLRGAEGGVARMVWKADEGDDSDDIWRGWATVDGSFQLDRNDAAGFTFRPGSLMAGTASGEFYVTSTATPYSPRVTFGNGAMIASLNGTGSVLWRATFDTAGTYGNNYLMDIPRGVSHSDIVDSVTAGTIVFANRHSLMRVTTAGTISYVYNYDAPSDQVPDDGQVLYVMNADTSAITWSHNAGAFAGKVLAPYSANYTQAPGAVVMMVYDETSDAWRIVDGNARVAISDVEWTRNAADEWKTADKVLIQGSNDGPLNIDYTGGSGSNTAMGFFRSGTIQGSISTTGGVTSFNTTSDARFKRHWRAPSYSLETLLDIRIGDFDWTMPGYGSGTGVSAQELFEVYPWAVTPGTDVNGGVWSVDYGKLTPLLVVSVQQLKAEIETLRSEVLRLKEKR